MFDEPKLISDKFPKNEDHGWKYIAFGPDDMLYVPVGAPCNVCTLRRFGSINFGSICRLHPSTLSDFTQSQHLHIQHSRMRGLNFETSS